MPSKTNWEGKSDENISNHSHKVQNIIFRRIQERVNQFQAEIQTLNRTKQELTEGKAKITENVTRLERVEVSTQNWYS